MKTWIVACSLLLTIPQAASPQQSKNPLAAGQGIDWQGDWGAAVKEATARNVPILITIHKDLCPRCKAMEEETLRNPKVIEISKSFVNVVAHRDTGHGSTETMRGREKVMMCNDYGNIPCEVHVKGWGAIGQFISGTFGTPTTVFCDPAGKELFRHEGDPGSADMIKKMNDALSKVSGEKILQSLWSQAVQLRADGDAALEKEDVKKASDLYAKLGKLKGAPFKTMSQEGLQKVDERGAQALKAALAIDGADQKKAALKKITEDYKGLPVAQDAKKELDAQN